MRLTKTVEIYVCDYCHKPITSFPFRSASNFKKHYHEHCNTVIQLNDKKQR